MGYIVAEIKAQNHNTATCSQVEAESWYYTRCEETQATVQRHMHSPGHSKEDLNRLNQAIQRLTVEVDGTQDQPCELETAGDPTALQAEEASCSAKDKLAWLEVAL